MTATNSISRITLPALDEALMNKREWAKERNAADEYVKLFSVMRHINTYSIRHKIDDKFSNSEGNYIPKITQARIAFRS
ncbi:MAG: hypothetical protein LBT81_06135 [Helicobacteraceae bacterium]|nr:hypothetical protein [Helicobacteraceae bacterium]